LTNRVDQIGSTVFAYDANNNRTNVVEAGKTNASTFDAYDRVSTYKDADGNLIQNCYDANGNMTNLVYPGNKTVKYFYDSLNRLTNVTDWASRQTTFTYDLASRVKTISRPRSIDCRPRKWRRRKEIRKIRAGLRAIEPILGRIFGL